MNRLTEDLLVMARVEAPSQELHPAPVAADALIRDAVKAGQRIGAGKTRRPLEFGASTSTQVFADTDAVMQVLSNLIEKRHQVRTAARAEPAPASSSARAR